MKNIKRFLKSENGAAQMVEAAIIYPIVFLVIFFLIYVGLFILQSITVSAYAQKIALLASREIAYPGYIDLVVDDNLYSSSAVEADLKPGESFDGVINLSFDPKAVETRAYRYWSKDPIEKYHTAFEDILKKMIKKNSIIGAKKEVKAKVTSKNYFLTQYVEVNVSQPLMDIGVLSFFGIDSPTVSVRVQAAVNDTDELIRNTDFAVDALEALAKKLGIDVNDLKEKIKNAKKKLGIE